MRHFDRKLFVVQHVLVKHLPDNSDNYSRSFLSESGKEYGNQNIQKRVLAELLEILKIIVSDKYDMKCFLPGRILNMLKENGFSDKELHFLLSWINECGQRFTENIECWKSSVNENLSFLSWNKYSCFKTADPNIFPVKVRISTDNSGITCITPDNNPWGEMIFEYPEAAVTGVELKECEGWMMWAEVERLEERYEFSFLFNTDGSEILSMESIMRDKNWIEFKIRCKNPSIKIINCNYAHRWNETGCQSTKIFLESCRALITKAKDIGTLYLNEKERGLLYLAQLYECFSSAINPEITDANTIDALKLEEFVNNQYGFEQTCNIISQTGDTEILEVLNNLKKYAEKKDIKKEAAECKSLLNTMEDRDKSSQGRLFYKNLAELMMEAASEYDKEWPGRSNFLKTRSGIIKVIEPSIIKMGFTGEFPHYRRISKSIGEYITIFSVNHGSSCLANSDTKRSQCVRISILTGCAPLTNISSGLFLSGLPFEKSDAWDCTWEKQKCRSVYIGPSDDEGWFEFNYDDKISSESDNQRKAEEMLPYLEVVNCTLKNKPLPEFYLKHHREYLKRNKTARKLMGLIVSSGLFLGLSIWVLSTFIFPLIFNNGVKKGFDIGTLFTALGCGALVGVVTGMYIIYVIRRKVWPS